MRYLIMPFLVLTIIVIWAMIDFHSLLFVGWLGLTFLKEPRKKYRPGRWQRRESGGW